MLKIKLLILLLISAILVSCTSNQKIIPDKKYSLGYIPGEYDGLIFSQLLKNNLMNVEAFDQNSKYKITGKIKHNDDTFVTNIDNTSDRQRIGSSIEILIDDTQGKCPPYKYSDQISQFYVFASSEKFTSNQMAKKKIKSQNTEILVNNFIKKVIYRDLYCNDIE